MNEVRVAFRVLKMYNLKINFEKTKAILTVVGTMSSKVRKHYVRKQTQERRLLLIPRSGCRLYNKQNISVLSYHMVLLNYSLCDIEQRKPTIADGPWQHYCIRGSSALATSCKFGEAVSLVLSPMACVAVD